mmetsp:Transcript_8603/g.22479  ORF Transcript_8603/g.22479 Transcript_8603/m.22479 type:complete len:327 (+) Transcript_8603:66-1046(+)
MSHWRDLARSSSGCAQDAAYATFVSGDKYVPGAMCLRRSLSASGNRCPMDIIFDDRTPERNLSSKSWQLLVNAYGSERLFPLSKIMAAHPSSVADMQYSAPTPRHRAGRGLFERGVEHMATHAKLWLWGLPRSRLVVLDSDMVVRGPLDWLTTLELRDREVAAVTVQRRSQSFFNSGLIAFRPGAEVLHNLTRIALLARSGAVPDDRREEGGGIVKTGEKIFGDQSLLNFYFRGRVRSLPVSTMAVAPARVGVDPAHVMATDPAVVHWLSEPKPWCRPSLNVQETQAIGPGPGLSERRPLHASSQAQLWWDMCRDKVSDVPVQMLG